MHMKTKIRFPLIVALIAVLAFMVVSISAAPQSGASDGIDGQVSKAPAIRSFVVLMDLEPAAVYEGNIEGLQATKAKEGEKFDAQTEAADDYAAYSLNRQDAVLQAAGVSQSAVTNRYTTVLNGFSALITEAQAEKIAQQPGVARVMKDTWRQPMTDASPDFLGLTGPTGAWATGYDGEGVLVGVVDSGIWPEHLSFADDGSYVDPGLTLEDTEENPSCEFGNTAHNPNDVAFTCNNKLVAARQMLATYRAYVGAEDEEFDSARDDNGHGTHTASTAAGNANVAAEVMGIERGNISGIAPRAYVLAYKGLGSLGGFGSDLAAAIDQAVADGVDVINYSIGGGASLTGVDDIAFLNAADAGVHAATSAGNSGPGPATVGGPGSVPWITTVGASTQSRFFEGQAVLGDGSNYSGASITPGVTEKSLIDAEVAGGDLCYPGTLDPAVVADKIVLCRRGDIARVDKSLAVYQAGGAGMIMYNNSDDDNLYTDNHWVPSVHIDYSEGIVIKAYIAGQPYQHNTYFPIVVGNGEGYVENEYPVAEEPTAEIVGELLSTWESAPSMTIFSSRGPDSAAEDIIKPDVTAPGLQILAGTSPFAIGETPGELFMAIAGTSMSSPHVAGLMALMDQAHPDWSPAAVKSALMTTSYQDVVDNDRVTPANPFAMGAGHVDPSDAAAEGSLFNPGLIYEAEYDDYQGFLCDIGPEALIDPVATCADLEANGVPTVARELNLPSIGVANLAGSVTITREVTSVVTGGDPIEYTVSVEAPEGYTVTVSPETFTLASGATQSFDVTFANESAPIREWAFGSLTWMSADETYVAYSPIAVRGAQIELPANLDETGASGSSSFDISFGYAGSYSATAHGLVPATVTNDNVVQDPDQTFDPEDGYSTAITFDMNDVLYFRVILPPDGVADPNIDLDMFLFDPTGAEVASSTNGGTDEQIDISSPMNGTWTLYVHGWQTVGDSADFTLYSWIVPEATGGSLVIDSAPASAVLATVGTVNYSWTGADGTWNLGAISHMGAEGDDDPASIGITLINIDNQP